MIQVTTKSLKFVKQELLSDKFVKYFIAGLIAFAVDTIVLYILKEGVFHGDGQKIFDIIYTSKLISATFGIIVSFYLNRRWAFDARSGSVRKQGYKMAIVFAVNILLASIIFTIYFDLLDLQNIINFGDTQITIANAATTGTQMFINFFLYKFIVFKD